MTKIIKCSCTHLYQSNRYGKGNRVMNKKSKAATGAPNYTCTVCGKEHKA